MYYILLSTSLLLQYKFLSAVNSWLKQVPSDIKIYSYNTVICYISIKLILSFNVSRLRPDVVH